MNASGKFTGKVEKKSLGSTILVGLLHAVFVVAELLEVGAGLGHGHGEGGGVDAESGDKGEDRRVGVGRG